MKTKRIDPGPGYRALFDAVLDGRRAAEPEWLITQRENAFESFLRGGFPSTRAEEWRFTDISDLAGLAFMAPPDGLPLLSVEQGERLPDVPDRLIFVDGCFAPSLSRHSDEVEVTGLEEALANDQIDWLKATNGGPAVSSEQAFTHLHTALLTGGATVRIGNHVRIADPIHMVFLNSGRTARPYSGARVRVEIGQHAQVGLVQTFLNGTPGPSLNNSRVDLVMEAGSLCEFSKLQFEGDEAFHVQNTSSIQGPDSHVMLFDFSMGGKLTRNDLTATLNGESSNLELLGIYAIRGRQLVDNHTTVDHAVPHCTSRQAYKGILDGRARAVFDGRIVVRPGALQTDAFQINKNLLLSDDSRVNTKPQLEISNDDVRCTHGATIGQVDDDQCFYLQSRGIERDEAIALLSRGFVEDVLYHLDDEDLQEGLRDHLDAFFEEGTSRIEANAI